MLGWRADNGPERLRMVQDPHEAVYPSMPQNALNNVAVDHKDRRR